MLTLQHYGDEVTVVQLDLLKRSAGKLKRAMKKMIKLDDKRAAWRAGSMAGQGRAGQVQHKAGTYTQTKAGLFTLAATWLLGRKVASPASRVADDSRFNTGAAIRACPLT